ncbi:MAG: plastocyanin/azurin family copper-binding protein [Dehalococcoidia bacterium]|nr:plastocyanin/azurin family copper-binding protein [Dehalococcoidia bacterium]
MGDQLGRWLLPGMGPLLALALAGGIACGDADDGAIGTIEFRTPTPGAEATTPAGSPNGEATGPVLEIETTEDDPLAFSEDELRAPAATEITVEYTNNSPIPHNIHFFEGSNARAPSIAMTDIATGPNAIERVTFTTPDTPGSYFFHCDVHPVQMQGDLVVE